MLNLVLYALLKNPALVRLAKGALAAAVSAGVAYIIQGFVNWDPAVLPPIIIPTLTALLLAFDKFIQGWGKATP